MRGSPVVKPAHAQRRMAVRAWLCGCGLLLLLLALRAGRARRGAEEQRVGAAAAPPPPPKSDGWGGSYLHAAADWRLTSLLDGVSKLSPFTKCAADLHVFKLKAGELESLNEGARANRSTLGPVLSGTAHRMPCRFRDAVAGRQAPCCAHPLHLRLGTTDFSVFQQVFQWHYLRYLYPLFDAEPPRYVLDAGANAGFSSALFKLLWPNATVVSLEPDAGNYEMLRANTKLFRNVHALNAGLWGRAANITLKTSRHGNWGKVFREAGPGEDGMPAYGVADLAAKLGIPHFDFVKIDIEGAEGMVFGPGADLGWVRQARAVSLEVHDYFAGYFGLEEVSSRIEAAFNATDYRLVSDNEHILYLRPELAKQVEAAAAAAGVTASAPPPPEAQGGGDGAAGEAAAAGEAQPAVDHDGHD